MPKVIHVLRKFVPSEWGGTETHLVHLVQELRAFGWQSEVHAPLEPGTDGTPLIEAGATFHTYRARYTCLGLTQQRRAALVASGGNLFSFDELARLLLRGRPAVLHVHAIGRLGGIVRLSARVRKTPYALTLHGPVRANAQMVEQDVARRSQQLVDLGAPLSWAVRSRQVVRDADMVFVLNPDEFRAWQDDRAHRHLALIPHGVDMTPAPMAMRQAVRNMVPGLGAAPFALVLGRLDATKGQDIAVEAFQKVTCPGLHLALVGSVADPDFAAAVRSRAASVGPSIHIVGGVSPSQARAFLAEASIVLIPSRAESFGLVLLEAWAEGTPTLFSDAAGLASIARHTRALDSLIPSWSVDVWAKRLFDALQDQAFLGRERRESPQRVARHYTWKAVARRVSNAYRNATLGEWEA